MKVFISWSGTKSNRVALAFKEWLPSVIQALVPYVSSEDIDKGARWSSDIAKELENSSFGILCVTKDNVGAPWLCFEAGALSKSIDRSLVIPFLLDVKRSEITGPILQFQSALFEKDEVRKLMKTLNKACVEGGLSDPMFDSAFEVWYPKLEERLRAICDSGEGSTLHEGPDDTQNELLEEILELSRTNQLLLRNPDNDLVRGIEELRESVAKLARSIDVPRTYSRRGGMAPRERRAMIQNLEHRVLLEFDKQSRFLVLLGMVRDAFPWVYSYGRFIVDVVAEGKDMSRWDDFVMTFEHMIGVGFELYSSPGYEVSPLRDDVMMLQDLSGLLVRACEDLVTDAAMVRTGIAGN